jgi:estrogen-related receptor beta like 1
MLVGVVKDVAAALEKIETREAYVNAQLAPLADEYRTRREKLDETQRAYDAASEATSSMTNELARLTEELEKVKGVIEDRGENNADATPLNTMKENMEKMREEIKVFEVRVAVCRSALLKHEVKRQAAIVAGKKAGGKKKRRPGADDDTPY